MNTQYNQCPVSQAIRKRLSEIIENEPNTLRAEVAQAALDYSDDNLEMFFSDLAHFGCVSGMIGGLVYYVDTHAFFDRYYDEIEGLRDDMQDSLGEPLRINGDLKNWLAWFGFEETAYQMAINDLKIDM